LDNTSSLNNVSSSFSSISRPFSAIYTEKLIAPRKSNEDGKKETKKRITEKYIGYVRLWN